MANEKRLDLIDRNALLEKGYWHGERPDWGNPYAEGVDAVDTVDIENAPTVDAVEVVHGRWVKHKPKPEAMRAWHRQGIGKAMSENSIFWTCSCCEEWGTPRYNYCPNCGAKMDGGNENGVDD